MSTSAGVASETVVMTWPFVGFTTLEKYNQLRRLPRASIVDVLYGLSFTAIKPFAINEQSGGELHLAFEERGIELILKGCSTHGE
jgi:hypothetical protein